MADFLGAMSGQVGSQFSSSAPDLLDQARLPGQIFRIQKKQQELLEKADSWAQYLARQPKPGVNLPIEVLENLREFHRREKKAAEHAETSLRFPRGGQRNLHQDDSLKSQASRSNSIVSENASDEAEDVGSAISWSPSPARGDKFTKEDSIDSAPSQPSSQVHHNDNDDGGDDDGSEQQAFMSQIPARSPLLQPTINEARTQQRARPVFNDFPSSSLGADEELEVVAPNALVEEQPAPKKSSQSNPTPPSAQVQVPCTFDANSSVPERPCKDLASIQTVQERLARKNKSAPAGLISLPQTTNHTADVPDSQSSVDSNSSVIPATNFSKQHRSPVRPLRMQPIKSTIKETPRLHSRSILQPTIEESSPPPPLPPPEHLKPVRDLDSNEMTRPKDGPGSSRIASPLPRAPSEPATLFVSQEAKFSETSWSPFVDYCVAYPSYTGSLTDFVSACLCIPKRRLATYQYDDFIRAWKEGYLSYVQGSQEGALVAIDWYMEMADDLPLAYQANVVTKSNLKKVLEAYPEEVALMKPAHEMDQVHKSQALDEAPLDVAEEVQHLASEAPAAPVTSTVDVESRADCPSRRSSTSSVGFEDPPLPIKPRASMVERAPGEPSAASKLRSRTAVVDLKSPQKRRSDDGVFQPPSKRTSRASVTPSEASMRAGPTVSRSMNYMAEVQPPPTSTGLSSKSDASSSRKKAKTVSDFKKFLRSEKVRKRHLDNISIASSAPPGTAPVYGRRGGPSN
ncbi:hypothetical protein PFICI_06232 [Pestalotiopsis fici W106-1]|uniref:Uncharacterized protein n=1 Tax=Pestalotiopsis fici (strain W106-1 / CGMCC3.15140) TaxID=1229662 RepID=W3X5B5_PESFW|nr:uncharacterized protein PFICI_06232 [Pestalotiopsis fici W106-1]ETS81230.1 hypothetical protein PFICI_06232 [Pestalotiopsis fici W106-1]